MTLQPLWVERKIKKGKLSLQSDYRLYLRVLCSCSCYEGSIAELVSFQNYTLSSKKAEAVNKKWRNVSVFNTR